MFRNQRGFADCVELSTQSEIVTSRRRAKISTRAASAKGAGEVVAAGFEVTNSLIDR
jgi:hypothetical protein